VAGTQEFEAHCAATVQLALNPFSGLHMPVVVLQPLAHCAALSHCTHPWPLLRQNSPLPQLWLQHTRAPPPAVAWHAPDTQSDPSVLEQPWPLLALHPLSTPVHTKPLLQLLPEAGSTSC
jgi:hypothetical protein